MTRIGTERSASRRGWESQKDFLNKRARSCCSSGPSTENRYSSWNTGDVTSHELASRFLLSSDFFPHQEDPKRPVRFVALYDLFVNPCYNPLTNLTS